MTPAACSVAGPVDMWSTSLSHTSKGKPLIKETMRCPGAKPADSQEGSSSRPTEPQREPTGVQCLSGITADHSNAKYLPNRPRNVREDLKPVCSATGKTTACTAPKDLLTDVVETSDRWNPERERNRDASASDDDSLSLLHGLDACQSRGAAADMGIRASDSQADDKEQKQEMAMEINAPEAGRARGFQSAAGCANSTSQSAANVLQCGKIPNKTKLNKRNGKGETLLHKACKREGLARVRALLRAGISVNMEDYAGWTALHEASAVGDAAVVEELLKAGANVNARSLDGVTPLHDAVSSGHYQVVKLLLLYGSNATDRNVGGLSALDVAEEGNIKELLLTFRASSVMHEQPCEDPAPYRQPGDPCSEGPRHTQRSCQSSCSHTANGQCRESGGRDASREPGDIRLRKKDRTHSEAVTVVLEDVRRKQTKISAWPLAGLEDAGRFHAALTQIQNVLTEVLAKQHLEKDNLAHKYRSVPDCLRQRVLKSQLVSLAARQRNLVEILQKQRHLVEAYVTTKATLSTQPPERHGSAVVGQRPHHVSTPASSKATARATHSGDQGSQSHGPVTQAAPFRSPPPSSAKGVTAARHPGPSLTQRKKAPTHTDELKTKASRGQSSAPHPGRTLQAINWQMKGDNALIQTGAADNSRRLPELIQRGVLPSGSALQLSLKGRGHQAQVLADGSIEDSRGKLHLAPECWLESILGNNIPVSAAYAWHKVTYRDKPLSFYLLNVEAEANAAQTRPEDDVQRCQEALISEAVSLKRLMKIKIIHLLDDEELLPNAVMDRYWEKLLNKDYSEAEDWARELL